MRALILSVGLVLALALGSCSPFLPASQTPAATPSEVFPRATETPAATGTALLPPPSPVSLTIWVPPQFDPGADTPQGRILQRRLEEFTKRRPGITVSVRIKAVEGSGGLLDALTTANAAAPLTLPDLVALPRPLLETAALKGLIYSLDGLTIQMDEEDWYEYSRELSQIEGSTFGLPFAGDALVVMYRKDAIERVPYTWAAAMEAGQVVAFPAADPQALFTLLQYQASGGQMRDDQGRPALQETPLVDVLTVYQNAANAGVMPYWLTQYQNQDEALGIFLEDRADMVFAWSSQFLTQEITGTMIAPLPTETGEAFTLATGWVWSLASPDTGRHPLGIELAEFLSDSQFASDLTEAAGFLPARKSSLVNWEQSSLRTIVDRIILSAHLYPPGEVLSILGEPLQQATIQVLKQQSDPQTAAEEAIRAVEEP